MPLLFLLVLGWADAPALDKETLLRLATASLERYRDVELGYEGWFEQDGKRTAFIGRYLRDGLSRSRIEYGFETRAADGGVVEVKKVLGLGNREAWEFKRNLNRPGGIVQINEALGNAVQIDCSYERAFLLPLLYDHLANRSSIVQTTGKSATLYLVRIEVGNPGPVFEYEIDLGKGCNVLKFALSAGVLGKLQSTTGVELASFRGTDGPIWFPTAATFENFVSVSAKDLLSTTKSAQRREWYAVTNGAFRRPAGSSSKSFEPPLDAENTVLDQVGRKSRTQAPTIKQPSATERESIIKNEMDRLEREGRLAGDASKPPTDYWRIGLFALGGVLLGAAAVVAFRRSRG